MRRWILAAAVVSALAQGSAVAGQDDLARVPRNSVADAKKGITAKTVVVVDVRDPFSYERGHIPGAVFIAGPDLQARAAELKASRKTIITYCG